MMRQTRALGVLAILTGVGFPMAGLAQPTVSFEADAVLVGLPAGGSAAVLSVTRRGIEYGVEIERGLTVVHDEDGDGVARLAVDAGVYPASTWWVVDLESGQGVVAAPEDGPVHWMAPEDGSLEAPSTPSPDLLVLNHSRLELLVVRPGSGAWRASAVDGGLADADGVPDGTLHVALLGLANVEPEGAALASLTSGDQLFDMDPNTLEVLPLSPQAGSLAATGGGKAGSGKAGGGR